MDPKQNNYWQPQDQPITPDNNAFSQPAAPVASQPTPVPTPVPAPQAVVTPESNPMPSPVVAPGPVMQVQTQPIEPQQPVQPQQSAIAEWDASEYIHHEKGQGWFIAAGGVLVVLMALAIFFQQWTFVGLLVVMGVTVVVYARRAPQVLHYALYNDGLSVNDQHFNYQQFKAFGIRQEGPLYSIVLVPVQRFATAVTMFLDPGQGEKIVDTLGSRLPMRPMEPDWIDKLTRRLRF